MCWLAVQQRGAPTDVLTPRSELLLGVHQVRETDAVGPGNARKLYDWNMPFPLAAPSAPAAVAVNVKPMGSGVATLPASDSDDTQSDSDESSEGGDEIIGELTARRRHAMR
jgi:hypothetical protein